MVWGLDIGIDLGTASVLVYVKGKGIVLQEPSVVALDRLSGRVLAVGREARQMLGRTPSNVVAVRPLKGGVIADYDTTERMLRHFLYRAVGRRWFLGPRVLVCVPPGITSVEDRAVRQACQQIGARMALTIEEPVAAALGAGLDIAEASGNMVLDIGGGTTDLAVLSLGGVVYSRSLGVGGDSCDEAITRHLRHEFNLMVGERTAEEIKIRIGTALPPADGQGETMEVRGRDMVTGQPRTAVISARDVYLALEEPVQAIVMAVKEVLERTPPELAADLIDRGMVMTGGGALLKGLDLLIGKETNLAVQVAEDPITCVVLGTGKALDSLKALARGGVISTRPG